jgi:hypothetical protein
VNNPFTSALESLGNNFSGLFNGTNPAFAPQVIDLFGFNLPGVPLISPRDYFLVQMESWFTAIPNTTQWVIVVDNYPQGLRTNLLQGLERHDGSRKGFDIDLAKTILTSFPLQKVVGCLFAHSVTIPTEQYSVNTVSVNNNRGFLPGILGGNRETEFPTLNIDFRETNTSFIDFVIRPWVILGSHFGMCARPGDILNRKDPKNFKVNMTLLQYTFTYASISMIPRKVFTFYNCMPYQIAEQTLDYTDPKLTTYNTRWTYSNYTVENNLYLPVADIVNRIANGSIPRVTSFQNGIGSINPYGFF